MRALRLSVSIPRALSPLMPAVLAVLAACSSGSGAGPDAGAGLSSAKSLTSFAFLKSNNAIPVDSAATFSGLAVHAFLPSGTDVRALKPAFAASDKATVSVAGASQVSGSSANDFTSAVSYLVTAEDGTTQTYSVTLTTELAAFDDAVQGFMATYAIPAASIAVTSGDRLVYLKAYGMQDKEAGQAATTQSLFRMASVSKPITSATVFKLVEQGKLALNDTVFGASGILGTTYGAQPYGPHITEITVDHLLHHVAGGWTNDGNDPMFLNPAMTAAQLISWTLDHQPLLTVPGASYAYSNFGYCILGRVIEKVTGMSYEAAAKSLVLGPLGINDMTIAGNTLPDRLAGEVKYYGQGGEDPYAYNVHRMDSHGGWVATAKDLANFLVHVDGFPGKADLLSAASITSMTTPSLANPNYGCGWSVNSASNWWHLGSLPGTASEVIRASIGWNWVILVNTRSPSANFGSDLDNLFWTAHGNLAAAPDYDLF